MCVVEVEHEVDVEVEVSVFCDVSARLAMPVSLAVTALHIE